MGLNSIVLALGPFRRTLLPVLSRPAAWYANAREGQTIIEQLCDEAPGTRMSCDLAAALGFDPWDFDKHAFDAHSVDVERLRATLLGWRMQEDAGVVIKRFLALRDAGFEFHFRPEG